MSPLLALHGFTGSPLSWDFLPERTGLLAPALVGHAGAIDDAPVASFDDELDRLATWLPDSGTAHVLGYSMGARLALGLAVRHPARVSRLTLVSGHPGLTSDTERLARRASDAAWCELLSARGLPAFVDVWEAQPLWATQAGLTDRAREQKRRERLSHSAQGLVHALRCTGLAEMPVYGLQLPEIRVPVTLIAGESDTKFSALACAMALRLPRARLEILPGAGHDLLLERPEFITEVIRRGDQP